MAHEVTHGMKHWRSPGVATSFWVGELAFYGAVVDLEDFHDFQLQCDADAEKSLPWQLVSELPRFHSHSWQIQLSLRWVNGL